MTDFALVGAFAVVALVLTALIVWLQHTPDPQTLHFDRAVTVKRRARVARIEKREER